MVPPSPQPSCTCRSGSVSKHSTTCRIGPPLLVAANPFRMLMSPAYPDSIISHSNTVAGRSNSPSLVSRAINRDDLPPWSFGSPKAAREAPRNNRTANPGNEHEMNRSVNFWPANPSSRPRPRVVSRPEQMRQISVFPSRRQCEMR